MTASYAAAAIGYLLAVFAFCAFGAWALGRSERFTATIDALTQCPECKGHGVVITGRDSTGAYEDRRCQMCSGKGTASAEDIEAYAAYVESMAS